MEPLLVVLVIAAIGLLVVGGMTVQVHDGVGLAAIARHVVEELIAAGDGIGQGPGLGDEGAVDGRDGGVAAHIAEPGLPAAPDLPGRVDEEIVAGDQGWRRQWGYAVWCVQVSR